MAEPLIAGLPPDLVIGVGYRIRLTALDSATGAVVTGVSISQGSVFATHLGGPLGDLAPNPLLVPSTETV